MTQSGAGDGPVLTATLPVPNLSFVFWSTQTCEVQANESEEPGRKERLC